MGILIADSTNRLAFTPTAADSVTLAATVDGEIVDFGTPTETDGVWSVTIASGDVPAIDSAVDVVWTITSGTQVRAIPERYWVDDAHRLVSVGELAAYLDAQQAGTYDRQALIDTLSQVEALVRDYTHRPLNVPPVTETKTVFVDGVSVWLPERVDVTAITDLEGVSLGTFLQSTDRILLHTPYVGDALVTGTFGTYTTPEWARRAILAAAKKFILGGYAVQTMDGEFTRNIPIDDLPNDTKRLLDRYRFMVL